VHISPDNPAVPQIQEMPLSMNQTSCQQFQMAIQCTHMHVVQLCCTYIASLESAVPEVLFHFLIVLVATSS
jgi:hypothetical protein